MKPIKYLLFMLLAPLLSGAQKDIDVFIWAGQSNAQGWTGDAAEYPVDGRNLDQTILLNWTFVNNESSGGEWIAMQPQKGRYPRGHFGPEVSFAREMKIAGYHPAIFKYCLGSTGLARDWKAPGEGGIYDNMVADLEKAVSKLKSQGFTVTVRGFIWIQGESDGDSDEHANAYYASLKRLIDNLRNEVLRIPNLKIILGVDEQHPYMVDRPAVLNAQKQMAREDENITFTSMYGLEKADATHLTPAALVKHGIRLFNAWSLLAAENKSSFMASGNLIVMSYNIWNGFDWGKDTLRRKALQQWVNTRQPDVLALQELCGYTPEKLQEDALSWGHSYSVLHKQDGYSVGLTSRYPIELKERIFEGLHHGALHCKSIGIDFLVVHLHPGSIKRRREETRILLGKLENIKIENTKYMVLGDFNANSPFDAHLVDPEGPLLTRMRKGTQGEGLDSNLDNNRLDFSVISGFLFLSLYDVLKEHTKSMAERASFPTPALIPEYYGSIEQVQSCSQRIDYILVSRELIKKCVNARICNGEENGYLSDHYPVIAEFDE
jgi:exodeoxyribonuclease III